MRSLRLDPGPVVVACSGGADSLALLAGTVFEARDAGWHVIGVTVDHGLQEGSAAHASRVVEQMAALGAHETVTVRVQVESAGLGIEAAARTARYDVLEEVAQRTGAQAVLLGHTLDDQAETVLLGLARGSGGRSIAGMRRSFEVFRRPLLDLSRAQLQRACESQGITWWDDPHNDDPTFTRVRVRSRVLPLLEEELGPGVTANLARTADLLRPDMELLDVLADAAARDAWPEVASLVNLHAALRTRVLRLAAVRAGAIGSELFRVHVDALDRLLREPQLQVQLPGAITAYVADGAIRFRPTAMQG